MNDIFGPPAVGVVVRCPDFQWPEGVINFPNKFCTFVSGSGEISFKSKISVLGSFDPDEAQALQVCAGVDEFQIVVVADELRDGAVCFHAQLPVNAGVFGLEVGIWGRLLLICDLGELVGVRFGDCGRYVGIGFSFARGVGLVGRLLRGRRRLLV